MKVLFGLKCPLDRTRLPGPIDAVGKVRVDAEVTAHTGGSRLSPRVQEVEADVTRVGEILKRQ